MKTKLDKQEQEIERSAGSYKPIPKKERDKLEGMLQKIRKSRNVDIRISESVLEQSPARK
jgi:hypothetical protein